MREMRASNDPTYSQLADITVSYDNRKLTWDLILQVIGNGTHAYAAVTEDIVRLNYLADIVKTHWYRGTDTILSEYPYLNWLSKKKWPLNEELNLHMMQYQEVTLHSLYLLLTFYSHYIPRRD